MTEHHSAKITPRDVIRIVRMRWLILVLGAVLFATGVFLFAHRIELKYTGTALFERRVDPMADRSATSGSESFESQKLTIHHDLAGYAAVQKAAEELNQTQGFPRDESGELTAIGKRQEQSLMERIRAATRIQWRVSSRQIDLIAVSFTDVNPWLAENMPNKLVEGYINRMGTQVERRLQDSRDFLKGQVERCDRRLDELIGERIDFEAQHAGALPDSPATLHESIAELRSRIEALSLEHNTATRELEMLEPLSPSSSSAAGDPNLAEDQPMQVVYGPNPDYLRLEEELRGAQSTLDELVHVKQVKDAHPTLKILRRKIARVRQQLKETPKLAQHQSVYGTSANDLTLRMMAKKAEVEMKGKELDRLEKKLVKREKLLGNFGPIRRQYEGIVNKIEDQQAELGRWESQLENAHMALATEMAKRRTHLDSIQNAQKQHRPSEPSFWRVCLFAIAGGLACGAALVFVVHRLDQSVMTPEQAASGFGVPVYGYADVILTPRQLAIRRVKRWVLTPVVSLVLALGLGLSAASLHWRVNEPDKYNEWRATPVSFLVGEVVELFKPGEGEY